MGEKLSEEQIQTLASAALGAFWNMSQSPSHHRPECPGGRTGGMLRWQNVDLDECTCPDFATLVPLEGWFRGDDTPDPVSR